MKKLLSVFAVTLMLTACGSNEVKEENIPNQPSVEVKDEEKPVKKEKNLNFDSETITGEKVNSTDLYAENEFTLVNIMASFCGPCIKEMPDLEILNGEFANVGVIGIVADTLDKNTYVRDEEAIEASLDIIDKTKVTYPVIMPDKAFVENNFKNAAPMFPFSYVVDSKGNIVSGPIGGARDLQAWRDIINGVLNEK